MHSEANSPHIAATEVFFLFCMCGFILQYFHQMLRPLPMVLALFKHLLPWFYTPFIKALLWPTKPCRGPQYIAPVILNPSPDSPVTSDSF